MLYDIPARLALYAINHWASAPPSLASRSAHSCCACSYLCSSGLCIARTVLYHVLSAACSLFNSHSAAAVFPQSFSYLSQAYPTYAQQSTSLSPPALYQHQHQYQEHHLSSAAGSLRSALSTIPPRREGGDMWWYVPSQPARQTPQYDGSPSYSYCPQAHLQKQLEASGSGGSTRRVRHHHTSTSALAPVHLGRDRPVVRRAYHPNPPPTRSDWVTWAGNILSDAVHDELWRFFTPPDNGEGAAGGSSSNDMAADSGERGRFCTQPDNDENVATAARAWR
ncbi:hypothetical protein K438DRAFT_1982995 [Mycena galopus ATCC 62051]|nr:hypothetical protein K438DRAFT_1982995 [Mycena galopus ATCC 62051]